MLKYTPRRFTLGFHLKFTPGVFVNSRFLHLLITISSLFVLFNPLDELVSGYELLVLCPSSCEPSDITQ